MQAHWPQQPNDQPRDRDVHTMTEDELDREIRLGLDDWCDLLDDLLNTCGMLPSRDRKSTRLNSSHIPLSRMPSSA